jgi:uncharacterized circularly permuted ATP-grasp superfamily protein
VSALRQKAAASSLEAYDFDPAFFDEAFEGPGTPRPHYADVLRPLARSDLGALAEDVRRSVDSRGVRFRAGDRDEPFVVDPVPRIFEAAEWALLEAGLEQRVRALNAFVADVHADARIVSAGRVPERLLEGAEHQEADMAGIDLAGVPHAGVAGLDVVRGADGRLMVLEDNMRTPSGMLYAEAALEAVDESLEVDVESRRLGAFRWTMLADVLSQAAPDGVSDPSIALLSDGPGNSAWWEHETIARRLDIPIVTLADLQVRNGRLQAWIDGRSRALDVVYRRTDEDRLRDERGRPTAMAEALLEPIACGHLACVNAFGSGVADDKLVHAYAEDIVRFYLDEEPLVPSVPTYDLAESETRVDCLARLDELVVKPRVGHGGHGVVIGPHSDPEELDRLGRAIEDAPERFVAQDTVQLSRHPTVCDGELAPRHVDLRPFVLSDRERVSAVPGGLTRVAFTPGSLVVNSSQAGGGKATWVLE